MALASRLLAEDDLRTGRLVRLFAGRPAVAVAFSLYLVCPPERRRDPHVVALLDWLREEFERGTP